VVLVGTYTSVFIASPILIYLGVRTTRALAQDESDAREAPAAKTPAAPRSPTGTPSRARR
jgi:hypothetical protein